MIQRDVASISEHEPGPPPGDRDALGDEVANAATSPGAPAKLPEIPVAEVATIANQEDLDRVAARHQQWINAVLDPRLQIAAGRANLQGLDLTAYSFAGINLSGANLRGANLANCDLERANLSACDLTNANLRCANLRAARLRGARIDGADLRGADLTGAVTTGLDLTRAVTKSA